MRARGRLPNCCRAVPRSRSWRPAGSRCASRARSAGARRRSRCPIRTIFRRWTARNRRVDAAVRAARVGGLARIRADRRATPPRWPTSAIASTACRWRSSSRPPAYRCCRRNRSPRGSATRSTSQSRSPRDDHPSADLDRHPGLEPQPARPTTSGCCSDGWRSSPDRSRWRRSRACASRPRRRTCSARSAGSSTRRSCSPSRAATSPATGCSRRCGSTARNGCAPPARSRQSAAGTAPGTSSSPRPATRRCRRVSSMSCRRVSTSSTTTCGRR